jgi:hypothetical protein
MTPERLIEIRDADTQVRIYQDRFDGKFTKFQEVRNHGSRSLTHRRELLEYIDELHQALEARQRHAT